MKDEIKEILDYLNKFINDKEEITKYGCEISVKNAKLLLDYITNLQEKVKLLTTGLEATDKAYKDYKSRNEKAINILELSSQNKSICTRPETDTIQSALNILKGE